MKKSILNAYAFHLNYARMLVADLRPEQMAAQPVPGMNHPAWVLGHLACSTDFGASLLKQPAQMPPEWSKLFDHGTKPNPDAKYPAKATLLAKLEEAHRRLAALLEKVDQATLDQPTPDEQMRKVVPTIGDALVFLATTHEAIHLGQLSAWRRAQGLPSVM